MALSVNLAFLLDKARQLEGAVSVYVVGHLLVPQLFFRGTAVSSQQQRSSVIPLKETRKQAGLQASSSFSNNSSGRTYTHAKP
eukprot:gene2425-5365_t